MPNSDDYKFDRDESPTCFIQVALPIAPDRERFLRVASNFATHLGLQPRPTAITASGRALPSIYEGADFLIAPMVAELPDPSQNYGQVRLELRRRSFPRAQFTTHGSEFIATMRTEFGSQVLIAGTD